MFYCCRMTVVITINSGYARELFDLRISQEVIRVRSVAFSVGSLQEVWLRSGGVIIAQVELLFTIALNSFQSLRNREPTLKILFPHSMFKTSIAT